MTYALIPSNRVAGWILTHIHRFLDAFGLEKDRTAEEIIYAAFIVCFAIALGWIVRTAVLLSVRKSVLIRRSVLGKELMEHHVLVHCSHIIPPLTMLALLPFAFTGGSALRIVVLRLLLIYTTFAVCKAVCSVTSFCWMRFDETRNSKNLPLRGILDTVTGILWGIAVIIAISILLDRSPVRLLTGLGAFAAVLMLIFKDSILGLVAGLQLSQNDMLRVGDWITVPSTIADGIVTDVSLTAVKVRNWDNTTVTLPPYTLVSSSFQNWRGMQESGCRRIARSVIIDSDSVIATTPQTVAGIAGRYPIIKNYINQSGQPGLNNYDPGLATVNGSTESNLGLFRIYLCRWLLDNPAVRHDRQILVRIMEPTGEGLPLQIYCFTATTAWTAYEAIQSAIIEHVAATAPDFGLRLFNEPAGSSVTTVSLSDTRTVNTGMPGNQTS